jgi:GNAT superfamily N-acetyltransferase
VTESERSFSQEITTVVYSSDPPDPASFFALFETTGWNATYLLSAEDLARAVQASWAVVTAHEAGRLVGFGRAICDGVVHALILDMIVAPDRQGTGIGSEILRRLMARCRSAGIRDVQLFCAKGKSDFYGKNGFSRRPEDAPGMESKWKPE